MVPLLPIHRQHLRESGLTDETIAAAQIESCIDPREAAGILGWNSEYGPAPAIAFPLFNVDGERSGYVLRPDVPHRRADGRAPKYEVALGAAPRPYFPPRTLIDISLYLNSNTPLMICEGIKKALKVAQSRSPDLSLCPIGIHGVDLFHDVSHRHATGHWRPHPDIARLSLGGRRTYFGFDGGDTSDNPDVIFSEARNAWLLTELEADVHLVRVPYRRGGPKVGIDDYLTAQPDPTAALGVLLHSALPANPVARIQQVAAIQDQVQRSTRLAALLADMSFAAGLSVGGDVIADLAATAAKPLGVRTSSIRGVIDAFNDARTRQSAQATDIRVAFPPEIEAAADELLLDPHLIERFHRGLAAEGVVGENDASLMLLLIMVTRRTKRPIHGVVKAASASGKNFVAYRVAARFPSSDLVLLTDMSARSLLFQTTSMKGKVFIFTEHEGTERAEYTSRVAMSEGSLSVLVAEKVDGGNGERIESRQHTVDGPACFITTTTRTALHDENETRVLEVTLDESEDQTRRIIRGQADGAANPPSADEIQRQALERQIWQCAMGKLELTETVNPHAHQLLEQFPTKSIRARRDFLRVLDLASASALLHQRQRQVNDGRVVVNEHDVRVARELTDSLYSATASPRLQAIASRLRSVVGSAEFTTAQAASALGYNTDAIRRTLGDMESVDLVRKVSESRGSKAAKWQMTQSPGTEPAGSGGGLSGAAPARTSAPVRPSVTDTVASRTPTVRGPAGNGASDCPTASTGPLRRADNAAGVEVPHSNSTSGDGRTVGRHRAVNDSCDVRQTPPEVGHSRPVGLVADGDELTTEGPIRFSDAALDEGEA